MFRDKGNGTGFATLPGLVTRLSDRWGFVSEKRTIDGHTAFPPLPELLGGLPERNDFPRCRGGSRPNEQHELAARGR